MSRFRHLGLQKRIMLYVAVGLAVMFGVVAVLGLDAIDEAARLVYRERLSTAHTTAGILERDFARVAATIEAGRADLFPGSGSRVPAGKAEDASAEFKAPAPREAEEFAGKTVELYLIPTKAGTYDLVCEIEGHFEAGMFGTITVTAAS